MNDTPDEVGREVDGIYFSVFMANQENSIFYHNIGLQ